MTTTTLLDCGHEPTPRDGIATGVAQDAAGRTYCYACSDAKERETMRTAQRFTCYMASERQAGTIAYALTTWPGGILGRVWIGKRHPWSRERFYVTATDVHGGNWYGTGAPGMWCSLRRCK